MPKSLAAAAAAAAAVCAAAVLSCGTSISKISSRSTTGSSSWVGMCVGRMLAFGCVWASALPACVLPCLRALPLSWGSIALGHPKISILRGETAQRRPRKKNPQTSGTRLTRPLACPLSFGRLAHILVRPAISQWAGVHTLRPS